MSAATGERSRAASRTRGRVPPAVLGIALALALLAIGALSIMVGSTGVHGPGEVARALGALLDLCAPLGGADQTIVELRLWRTLVAAGVGAGLALSGGLLQGVFRNDLASPSVIGVSSGACLGASLAILMIGGYGSTFMLEKVGGAAPILITAMAFAGAVIVCFVVAAVATTGGRISVPTLLLVGVAMNAMTGGMLAAIQSFALHDTEVARAMITWTFGTLDDRFPWHAAVVGAGVLLSACAIPFVALELDLFAGGEEDAQSLGVDPSRVKLLALLAAALGAAVAVAVAGQIAFVGLVVPHLVRLASGSSHRTVLPLCLLGGPVFLLGTDLLQRWLLGDALLQPGVLMSLVGGPFFLFLLFRNREMIRGW